MWMAMSGVGFAATSMSLRRWFWLVFELVLVWPLYTAAWGAVQTYLSKEMVKMSFHMCDIVRITLTITSFHSFLHSITCSPVINVLQGASFN